MFLDSLLYGCIQNSLTKLGPDVSQSADRSVYPDVENCAYYCVNINEFLGANHRYDENLTYKDKTPNAETLMDRGQRLHRKGFISLYKI